MVLKLVIKGKKRTYTTPVELMNKIQKSLNSTKWGVTRGFIKT